VRVKAGEQWWLEPEYEEQLAEHNQDHQQEDSWTEVVRDWLERLMTKPQYVTVRIALEEAVGKEPQHITRADDMRMADVLRAIGWHGPVRRYEGMVGRFWLPPGAQLPLGGSDERA
jgi:predicted P-loop ATPase